MGFLDFHAKPVSLYFPPTRQVAQPSGEEEACEEVQSAEVRVLSEVPENGLTSFHRAPEVVLKTRPLPAPAASLQESEGQKASA